MSRIPFIPLMVRDKMSVIIGKPSNLEQIAYIIKGKLTLIDLDP